jgi:hypothetical protein
MSKSGQQAPSNVKLGCAHIPGESHQRTAMHKCLPFACGVSGIRAALMNVEGHGFKSHNTQSFSTEQIQ